MNWMHSCRRAAQLLSQRLDQPLGTLDELKLRLHLSLCGDCRNVEQQLNGIHAAAADLFAGAGGDYFDCCSGAGGTAAPPDA